MEQKDLLNIIKLRVCIGFLGEAQQFAWWQSTFFHISSSTFLNPVFGKTSFLAKYYGVKEAASIIHDEHIGIGKGVYHLFRLPELTERKFHEILKKNEAISEVEQLVINKELALEFLLGFGAKDNIQGIGPLRIGATSEIDKLSKWNEVAGCYYKAFHESTKIFPYFSEDK